MRFQSIFSLNRHQKALHSYNPISNVQQNEISAKKLSDEANCTSFYETGEDEDRDLDDYELISCDICEKFFSTKDSLKNHTEKSLCRTNVVQTNI